MSINNLNLFSHRIHMFCISKRLKNRTDNESMIKDKQDNQDYCQSKFLKTSIIYIAHPFCKKYLNISI